MADFEKWWIEQGEDLLEIGNIYEIAMSAWNAADSDLRAEIKRKDEAIKQALDYLADAYVGSAKITLSQAMLNEEVSDEGH